MKPKKAKAYKKKTTLFEVRELFPPRDRLGRPAERMGGGWKLGYRVEVRGHFKWQPHGPKKSKRKLIWVEPYERGPKDGEKKPILEKIGRS